MGDINIIVDATKNTLFLDIVNSKGEIDKKTLKPLTKNIYKLGRKGENEICIKSYSISRIQCTFYYFEDEWFILDGDGNQNSTNGNFILLDWDWCIEYSLMIRVGFSIFSISLLNSDK